MVALNGEKFGTAGLYSRGQIASLARVTTRTMSRWFAPSENGRPAVAARYLDGNEFDAFGFVDLIQLVAVRSIRLEASHIPFDRIRQARADAERRGFKYAFASDLRFFGFGRDLFIKTKDGDLIGASGEYRSQQMLEPILQPYLVEFHFDAVSGLADEFRPLPGILLTPRESYGAPVVEGTGYTVETLVSTYRAEGDYERAARVCGVDEEKIRLAMRYENILCGRA